MYLSLYEVKGPDTLVILAHIWSNLAADYPQQLQMQLETVRTQEPVAWRNARVVAMYRGLAEEPEEQKFLLPDGREVQMFNINPGCTNQLALAMADYSSAMNEARSALLAGETAEMAARKLCAFCELKGIQFPMADDHWEFRELVEEMELYQAILEEDLRNMRIKECAD